MIKIDKYTIVCEDWIDDDTFVILTKDVKGETGNKHHLEVNWHVNENKVTFADVYENEILPIELPEETKKLFIGRILPVWCKPLTKVYRKSGGGSWLLYDIISITADGVKVRTFENYRDHIETKTLEDIKSDGEKVENGEYEAVSRKLLPGWNEAIKNSFDVLPVGTVISLEQQYLRITGYDQEHHRYMTTSVTGTGIRAEFVGTYFIIGGAENEHTAKELPTWCKVGVKVNRIGVGDFTICEISDGIVWLSRYGRDREGMSIDAFIWRSGREFITLLEGAPEPTL